MKIRRKFLPDVAVTPAAFEQPCQPEGPFESKLPTEGCWGSCETVDAAATAAAVWARWTRQSWTGSAETSAGAAVVVVAAVLVAGNSYLIGSIADVPEQNLSAAGAPE